MIGDGEMQSHLHWRFCLIGLARLLSPRRPAKGKETLSGHTKSSWAVACRCGREQYYLNKAIALLGPHQMPALARVVEQQKAVAHELDGRQIFLLVPASSLSSVALSTHAGWMQSVTDHFPRNNGHTHRSVLLLVWTHTCSNLQQRQHSTAFGVPAPLSVTHFDRL